MPVFYAPQAADGYAVLNEEESVHCVRVLRLGAGDRVTLADGCGGFYTASIEDPHPKHCGVTVTERLSLDPEPLQIQIAVAPTKNPDRIEWLVEKCTEIGVTDIALLMTAHSERKSVNLERLHRIAVSAMKQSQRAWLPRIHPMTPLPAFLASCGTDQKMIAHCEDTQRQSLASVYRPVQSTTVLIGPEGDFSPEEIAQSLSMQFVPVTLGDLRLRTETAAVVACHSLVLLNAMAAEGLWR